MLGPSRREPLILDFYKGLHISLGKPISEQCTTLIKWSFRGAVQRCRTELHVRGTESVSEVANEYMEDVVSLTNLISAASFATSTGRTEKRLWDQ